MKTKMFLWVALVFPAGSALASENCEKRPDGSLVFHYFNKITHQPNTLALTGSEVRLVDEGSNTSQVIPQKEFSKTAFSRGIPTNVMVEAQLCFSTHGSAPSQPGGAYEFDDDAKGMSAGGAE